MNNRWELIQSALSANSGVSKAVLDYIAVDPILKLCVGGRSNQSIAGYLGFEIKYVKESIQEFLEFDGWENDLDINPWYAYQKSPHNQASFTYTIQVLTGLVSYDTIVIAYSICSKYDLIRKEIEKYYEEG